MMFETDVWSSGLAVERMLEKGKAIILEAIEEHRPVAIVAAFSGGNDSIVSTHFACKEFGATAIHADTLVGCAATRDHVDAVCDKLKCPLIAAKAHATGRPKPYPKSLWVLGETAYEEFTRNFGFAGRAQHHRMYQRLKERPLRRMLRQMQSKRGQRILIISGIRHDESAVRAGYKRAIQRQGSEVWVNPFYYQTAADFECYRQEFGLPRNPVKDRIGLSGECLCGAFASRGEREAVRAVDPVLSAYLDKLESEVVERFPWSWGTSPPKWFMDLKRDQGFLFDSHCDSGFMPMCVGCVRKPGQILKPEETS